jgi:signal transduction histidine kinase
MEPKYRILMVDDVTRYHTLYEMAITDAIPAKVHFAANGEEALEKLASPVPYDLLILDLNMPKLGGEETLIRIRQDANLDNMPVIILTGEGGHETHRRLLDLGADDFVEKGSPPELFVARLKAQIRHKLALDRLTRLAVDMDIFAAGVLHDIKNLEASILSICELARAYLDEDPLGRKEQITRDLTALEDKADNLGRYATEIIRMVRETQKPLDPKPQPIGPLLDWVVKIAAPRLADEPGLTLTCRVEGTLAPVVADRHFLQLALLNLMQNAVKYRRPGVSPEVIVRQRPGGDESTRISGNRTIVTCLHDNGIGIKKQELRKVFEPFVRGSGGASSGGFGLGLSLVQKVMTAMGGRVWAELPNGAHGTVMCLELPAAQGGAS